MRKTWTTENSCNNYMYMFSYLIITDHWQVRNGVDLIGLWKLVENGWFFNGICSKNDFK